MDSFSEMDETVHLDDSEWVPSENYSDDDSIEIVGELMEAKRPVRCSTRATRGPTKPTSTRSLVLIDSDDDDELPSLDPPQIQQKITPQSPKHKFTRAQEDSKEMAQKRIRPVSTKSNVAGTATRPSLARYTTHGPPLGVDLSALPEEDANTGHFQGTKRKQPSDAQPLQKNLKRGKTPGQTEDFVRLSENGPFAKKRKICSLSNLKNKVRGTVNNNFSSVKSIPASRLGSHSQLSTLKTDYNPNANKSVGVEKEVDSDVHESAVVLGTPRVKKEVIDYEQQPALPSLTRVKRENFDPACPQNGNVFGTPPEKSRVKLEASTMSLDCSTSSEFSPVKKKCPPAATKAVKKSTITSEKVKASPGDISYNWDAAHVISLRQGIDRTQAKEIIKLVDQECTLPFIARYRREQTGNLDVNKLREVLNSYEQLKEVKEKVSKLVKEKKTLAPETRECLLKATSLQEVKTLTASLRSSGTKTYADRARKLGLGEATEALLKDPSSASTRDWASGLVVSGKEGLKSVEEVETGVKFILADIISKNPKLTEHMRTWLKRQDVVLKSCTSRKAASQVKVSSPKSKKVIAKRKSLGGKTIAAKTKKLTPSTAANIGKYEKYFNFAMNAWRVHSHSVCAINRGEQQGVLTVKVLLPSFAYREFEACVAELWLGRVHNGGQQHGSYRHHLIQDTLSDCWERLVSPSLQSWVRSQLSETAELASIEVFVTNLRHLLLTPSVRANTVLAIDPGFHKGCKIAVVERKGKVLAVETIHPFTDSQASFAAETLSRLVCEYRCEIIAIGNGTACRETEAWLSQLIRTGAFPGINVQYTIVNESGASHYSVTDEARAEFPSMDVNHISAVSLARRLQDPLLEYVKVPPMHLGVGMYQHDVSNKLLTTALDSVVMECVSFVGVDLNVASEVMLRKVSGLTKARATAIVKYRDEVGPFRDREQLKKVKGIGPVSFQQCAGFVKVVPQTLRQRSNNSNLLPLCPLDSTTVHPESYTYAEKLIRLASLDIDNIGSSQFIEGLKSFVKCQSIQELSEKCGCSANTLDTILESLYQPLDFDYRAQFESPLFRKGVTSISELKLGQHLTGSVMNVTTFGAFVDIGVGNDGLMHKSRMRGLDVHVGNTVEVKVANLDIMHRKVGLELVSLVR